MQFVVGLHPLIYASNVRLPTLADSMLADMQDCGPEGQVILVSAL